MDIVRIESSRSFKLNPSSDFDPHNESLVNFTRSESNRTPGDLPAGSWLLFQPAP
jgi:hypothetical protein